MKKLISILCSLATAFICSGAAIPGTVVSDKITTGNTLLTGFGIGDTSEMTGTEKQAADTAARLAIPTARRTVGMTCYQIDTGVLWRLVGGTDNANWALSDVSTSVYDANAMAYIQAVGISDIDPVNRINSFVLALKSFGLWTGMDGILLRTNFNNSILRTFAGAYATNVNGVTIDGAGTHYDGLNDYTVIPSTISPTNTILVVYAGDNDQTSPAYASPFGMFNLAGTNAGAIYPHANGLYQMRWAIKGTGAGECSPLGSGWFGTSGYSNGSSTNLLLLGVDFRQHIWSISWDNQGNLSSCVDGSVNLTNSGYASTLTNGALNSIVLGGRLNASGSAEGFTKMHVQAVFVWNKVFSLADHQKARDAIQWLLPGDRREVWIGDSMSAYNGPNEAFPYVTGQNEATYWPAILHGGAAFGSQLGTPDHSDFTPLGIAVNGITAYSWTSGRLLDWLHSYGIGGQVKESWANVWIGINDLGNAAHTGENTFLDTSNIWWICKNDLGMKVRAFTIPNTGSNSVKFADAYYTNTIARSNFNALVRASHTQWDELVDLDMAFPISAMQTNVGNSYDGLHMTAVGHTNMVKQLKPGFRAGKYTGEFSSGMSTGMFTTWTNLVPGIATNRITVIGGIVVSNVAIAW